jgi:hypothetical protein
MFIPYFHHTINITMADNTAQQQAGDQAGVADW